MGMDRTVDKMENHSVIHISDTINALCENIKVQLYIPLVLKNCNQKNNAKIFKGSMVKHVTEKS